jgi:hypothetical protein
MKMGTLRNHRQKPTKRPKESTDAEARTENMKTVYQLKCKKKSNSGITPYPGRAVTEYFRGAEGGQRPATRDDGDNERARD